YTLGSDTDRVCVLTSIGGKFAGLGEHVRIEKNSNDWWQLRVSSGRTKRSEHVHREAMCFERGDFFNGTMYDAWLPEDIIELGVDNDDDRVELESGDYPAAFCGMKGLMRGGGEYVEVNYQNAPQSSELIVQSMQGKF